MALDGILFDVDGTLVDTNSAHVDAWVKAFDVCGYRVAPDRIFTEIGKGGDKLLPSILGSEAARQDGEKLTAAHDKAFTQIAQSTHLPLFPGVENLLLELRRRKFKTVLATSSNKKGLELTFARAGIDLTQLVDEVVTADDAKESKPAPDIVVAAIKKLGLSPAQCVMVGDTPHDISAARDAGVVTLSMSCGGVNDAKTLRTAGARAVYRDPADLLAKLDEALRVASPGAAHLDQKLIESLMAEALRIAAQGMESGEVPIGCVLADGTGRVICAGHNELNHSQNKTAHAEMVAFARSAGKMPADAKDMMLVSTLEPCVMCLGASMEAAVDVVLFGLHAPADGGTHRVQPPVSPESQMPRVLGNILAAESRGLFEKFLKRGPQNPQQEAFARQLLAMT